MLVPHTTYAHALCSCAHMTDDSRLSPPPSFSHVPKQNGCFLRSAIIPSAECRQRNYLVGTPGTPIPHSPRTLSQWEIKQNHLDRSGTNTSKPFVCHTWGPQMDSHHTVDWKFMLIYTSAPLSPNITAISPATKWPYICPCCPLSTNLPSPAFDDTRDTMWCSLITRHMSPGVLKERTRHMHISPAPRALRHCRSNE